MDIYMRSEIECVLKMLGYEESDLILTFRGMELTEDEVNKGLKSLGLKVNVKKLLKDIDIESVYAISKLVDLYEKKLKRNIGIKSQVTVIEQMTESIYESEVVQTKKVEVKNFEEKPKRKRTPKPAAKKNVEEQIIEAAGESKPKSNMTLQDYIDLELENIEKFEREETKRLKANEEGLSKSEQRRSMQNLQQKIRMRKLTLQSSSIRKELAEKYNLEYN